MLTLSRPLEKYVQAQCAALFRSVGGVVRSTSQYRASGVALGLPDLHVSFVRVGKWTFFECKRPIASGFDPLRPAAWIPERLRPAQIAFRDDCAKTGQPFAWGGLREAEEVLVAFGLGVRLHGVLHLTPAGRAV